MNKNHVSVNEACRLLGVHRTTFYNWLKSGRLPSIRHPINRQIFVERHVIDELLKFGNGASTAAEVVPSMEENT